MNFNIFYYYIVDYSLKSFENGMLPLFRRYKLQAFHTILNVSAVIKLSLILPIVDVF